MKILNLLQSDVGVWGGYDELSLASEVYKTGGIIGTGVLHE